jgi:hypothetical protein
VEEATEKINAAVTHWTQKTFQTKDIFIAGLRPDDDEPDRYLVTVPK